MPPTSQKQELLEAYRTMVVIRRCEEALAKAHQRGLVHGACHTYVGQEAIAAGVCAHLRREDAVFSTHRGHGHALAKGLEPKSLIAELFGRETGCSRGRGGSMHLFAPEIGLMGTSGIVGPCILQAAGAGYAFKLANRDNVGVAFFGDGAVNNGAFHEGLNMASIWKLPSVFICENNQFATEVPFAYSSGNPSVGNRGDAYGLPSVEIDGNDLLAVIEAAGEAIDRARTGEGATLIECKTYRTRAHAEGMVDFTYRTRQEVEEWKERCPIARVRSQLIADSEALDKIDAEVETLVQEAVAFAESSGYPDGSEAVKHVYAGVGSGRPAGTEPGMNTTNREATWMQAGLEALASEMEKNDRIFVLGEGIGKRGGNFATTQGLYELYGPDRLCDTPICERGFVGLACGAAMAGARPVVDFMFADFVLDGVGEIVNQIAKMQYMSSGRLKMPVLLRGCIGIGHSAATHHSGNYYSMYAHFPGLRVVVPSTAYDAKGLLTHALRCEDPVLFLEHRELLSDKCPVPEEDYEIPFGSARIARRGKDVTVVALARMVNESLAAAESLAPEGIDVEVVDPRTLSPLDEDAILSSISKTGRLLVVDEDYSPCGFAGEVMAVVSDAGFDDLDAPLKRLTGKFVPTPYSPSLENAVVMNSGDITAAIRDLMEE
jgi:2-oxoisovalerate dehydrogenase E1 component